MDDFLWVLPLIGTLVGALITGTVAWVIAARARKAEARREIRAWAVNFLEACGKVSDWDRNSEIATGGRNVNDLRNASTELAPLVGRTYAQGDLFVPDKIREAAKGLAAQTYVFLLPLWSAEERVLNRESYISARYEFINAVRKSQRLKALRNKTAGKTTENGTPDDYRKKLMEDPVMGPRIMAQAEELLKQQKGTRPRERPSSEKPAD